MDSLSSKKNMNVNVGDLVVCEYEYEGLLPEVYKNVGYLLIFKNT